MQHYFKIIKGNKQFLQVALHLNYVQLFTNKTNKAMQKYLTESKKKKKKTHLKDLLEKCFGNAAEKVYKLWSYFFTL